MGIRRYNLSDLANLGLIEYDVHKGFVLPPKPPLLKYETHQIQFSDTKRVNYGNVRLTKTGRILYHITSRSPLENFIPYCCERWNKMQLEYSLNS